MPRQSRKKSNLCIHHVILRGINRQIIFEDNSDYLQFISIMKYYKNLCNFKLYAYCLMNNHIHLLIEHTTTNLDEIMKKIEVKFVRWYNRKYQRTGHLFQERYKSEPVNDMRYFLTVFRYHQECMEYLQDDSNEKCMEYISTSYLSDMDAIKIIQEKTICKSPSDFQHLELFKRNQYLKMLYHSGISIRQLSRLTGISRTVISKVVK